MSRKYTNQLLEMIEEGLLDKDQVIMACVKYMSEDDVKDMMECNEFIITEKCEFCGYEKTDECCDEGMSNE